MTASNPEDDRDHEADAGDMAVERFRSYLLLARIQLGRQAGPGIDPPDLVQQTLLDAHRHCGQLRSQSRPRWRPGCGACSPATSPTPTGGHAMMITQVLFRSDGLQLASLIAEGATRLWDATPRR